MEITIKFTELEEAQMAMNGSKYANAIFEFDQFLREQLKWNDTLSEETYDKLEELRTRLREILSERDLFI